MLRSTYPRASVRNESRGILSRGGSERGKRRREGGGRGQERKTEGGGGDDGSAYTRVCAQNLISSSSSSSSSTSPTSGTTAARRPHLRYAKRCARPRGGNLDSDIELSVDVSFFPSPPSLSSTPRAFHDCEYAVILK